MRRLVLAALSLAFVAACQPATTELTEERKAEIAAEVLQIRAELAAVNERLDVEAFLSFFTDDLVAAKELDVMDYETFARRIEEDFNTYDHYVITQELAEVSVLSEDAVAVTDKSQWVMIAVGGDTVWAGPATFTSIFVLRDGDWKVVHLHGAWVE
jgi:ketosteroid isomerase-like protein